MSGSTHPTQMSPLSFFEFSAVGFFTVQQRDLAEDTFRTRRCPRRWGRPTLSDTVTGIYGVPEMPIGQGSDGPPPTPPPHS
eukprot:13900853-Alexandrium_andersonii.AAC.1